MLLAIAISAAQLLAPRAEPTLSEFAPPLTNWPALTQPGCAFVTATNCAAYTYTVWLKSRDYPALAHANLGVNCMLSATASRSTAEGGPELPAAYDSDTEGDWEEDHVFGILDKDVMGGGIWDALPEGTFPHGVYTVQIENRSGLYDYAFETSDGFSRYVPAEVGSVSFNYAPGDYDYPMWALAAGEDEWGDLPELSEDDVRVAIAAAPVVQFVGSGLWNYDPYDSGVRTDRRTNFLGINPDEYQLIAVRARVIDAGHVAHRIDALAWDVDYLGAGAEVTNALRTPLASPCFERDASCRLQLGSLYGKSLVLTNAVYSYGARMWDGWLTDGRLRLIRDRDVEVMRERGVVFGVYSNNWTLTYKSVVQSAVATGETEQVSEPVSWAVYTRRHLSASNAYTVVMGVENVPAADPSTHVSAAGLAFTSPSAVSVSSNVLAFAGAGSYAVTAAASNGVTKTATVTVSGGAASLKRLTFQGHDTETVGERLTMRARDALEAAAWPAATNTVAGVPARPWRVRRTPCLPTRTYRGGDTRGCVYMGALSPRTYFSAWHWKWWYSGMEEWPDSTGGVHRAVTDYNSVVRLVDWAAAQGIPTNGVAEWCGDIAVGAFSSGTVPAELCPWLMSTNAAAAHFATAPVPGWAGTQTACGWALPNLINPRFPATGGGWFRTWTAPRGLETAASSKTLPPSSADDLAGLMPEDLRRWLDYIRDGRDFLFPPVYGGDSGIGIFIEPLEGTFVLVSHYTTAGSGPSYVAAFPLLKAWIEAHGDEVKEWEGDY